jgi:alpha-beta hydrolase superfamily lysophospholipase
MHRTRSHTERNTCGSHKAEVAAWRKRAISCTYERYAVPGPDHVLFQASFANFNPHAATIVNFHNDTRAPLLLVAGGKDHVAPAAVTKANFNLYKKSLAVTDYKEFPDRSHFTIGEAGWEEVADYALEWAATHAANPLVELIEISELGRRR